MIFVGWINLAPFRSAKDAWLLMWITNQSELPRISISFNVMFAEFPKTMDQPLWGEQRNATCQAFPAVARQARCFKAETRTAAGWIAGYRPLRRPG